MKSKKTIRKHLRRLTKALKNANDLAWYTTSVPGPCFTNTEPGPDKDRAWKAHASLMAAYQEEAAEMCRAALRAAPPWLRESQHLVEKAFDKVFAKGGVCTAGPGIPCLTDIKNKNK